MNIVVFEKVNRQIFRFLPRTRPSPRRGGARPTIELRLSAFRHPPSTAIARDWSLSVEHTRAWSAPRVAPCRKNTGRMSISGGPLLFVRRGLAAGGIFVSRELQNSPPGRSASFLLKGPLTHY